MPKAGNAKRRRWHRNRQRSAKTCRGGGSLSAPEKSSSVVLCLGLNESPRISERVALKERDRERDDIASNDRLDDGVWIVDERAMGAE